MIEEPGPLGPDEPVIAGSPRGAPSPRRYRPETKVVSLASDALCRAPSSSFGLTGCDSRWRRRQARLCPPSRQRRRASSVQGAFHRRPALRCSLSRCFAWRAADFCHPIDPRAQPGSPLNPRITPEVALWHRAGGADSLAAPRRSSFLGSGPDRLSPHRRHPLRKCADRRASRDGWRFPNPPGSDTFCRAFGEPPDEETGTSGALTRPSRTRRRACSREARCLPPRSRGPFGVRTASCAPPRRGAHSAAPKVSSIPEEHLPEAEPARRTEQDPWPPEGGLLSTGCSHPVDKRPAPFSSSVQPALTERGRGEESGVPGTCQPESRYVWSASAAPSGLLRSGRSAARLLCYRIYSLATCQGAPSRRPAQSRKPGHHFPTTWFAILAKSHKAPQAPCPPAQVSVVSLDTKLLWIRNLILLHGLESSYCFPRCMQQPFKY
jgi:hypothetical protein